MLSVKTLHHIAGNSADHLYPLGTKNDNNTSETFITEVEDYFKVVKGIYRISVLDLGCAGGQLIVDFVNRGHVGVGLEGSDYNVIHGKWNWPVYHNKNLFNCDVTKPYQVYDDDRQLKFDLIMAWELVEHIPGNDLRYFFKNVSSNLDDGGIFIASINTMSCMNDGHELHVSVHDKEKWFSMFREGLLEDTGLLALPFFPFRNKVRKFRTSLYITMIKKYL